MLIAVDFDGTIVPDIFFPDKVPDRFMPGAKEALTELHRRGHTLVLWTLRDHDRWKVSRTLQIAVDFLNANGLGFMILPCQLNGYFPNTPKFPADIYIDDKIPGGFQGWDVIRKSLINDGVSDVPTAGKSDGTFNASFNAGNVRTDHLDQGRGESMRRSGSVINKAICGPLLSSGNQNRNQPDVFSCVTPLDGTQVYVCPSNYNWPFHQQVDRPLPAALDARGGLHQSEPLFGKGTCCSTAQTTNDDATKSDLLVHTNEHRHVVGNK